MKRLFVLGLLAAAGVADGDTADVRERFELSAPILPRTDVLYAHEGANYPADQASRIAAVRAASLTFDALLAACATTEPTITAAPTTDSQIAANYDAVARCAYERFTSKPYWIPQFVNDVDVCAEVLGDGWRLPTAGDVAAFDEGDFTFFRDTLTAASSRSGWAGISFSLDIYVRGSDGSLQDATLEPGVTGPRVTPMTRYDGQAIAGDLLKVHREDDKALRCLRRTIVVY